MADNDTLYTLADLKDFLKYYAGNALIDKTAKKRINKYIEAVDNTITRMQDPDRVKVVRCGNCRFWHPNNAEEGDCSGVCHNIYRLVNTTDMTWFCADGEG